MLHTFEIVQLGMNRPEVAKRDRTAGVDWLSDAVRNTDNIAC